MATHNLSRPLRNALRGMQLALAAYHHEQQQPQLTNVTNWLATMLAHSPQPCHWLVFAQVANLPLRKPVLKHKCCAQGNPCTANLNTGSCQHGLVTHHTTVHVPAPPGGWANHFKVLQRQHEAGWVGNQMAQAMAAAFATL